MPMHGLMIDITKVMISDNSFIDVTLCAYQSSLKATGCLKTISVNVAHAIMMEPSPVLPLSKLIVY